MNQSEHKTGEWGQFVAEIRRRHVVRFALAYAAAAFVVLQLAEIVFPAFGIGESGLRLLVIVTTLAFPPALVLAWLYDLTTEGLRRTDDQPAGPLLHRVAVGALLIATIAATGGLGLYLARQGVVDITRPTPAPSAVRVASYDPNEPIRSIAVLPLDDFSPGDEQAYFTSSMHEELIAKLSMLDEIRVVSRTSVMRYDGTTMDMPTIGRELGVDVIVEGSVTRTPERTRVTLQLIHAPSDSHIETLQWDRVQVDDVLAFQTEIAQEVVAEVASQYDPSVFTAAAVEVDPAAQDAYFRGRYEYERGTPEGYRMALAYFEDAIQEDPDFAPALAGLAGARFLISLDEEEPSAPELTQAHEEAMAAMELDSESAEAREVLALIERSMPQVTGEPLIPAPPSSKRVHIVTMQDGVDSILVDMDVLDTAWVASVTSLGERIEERVRRWSVESRGSDSTPPNETRDMAFRARQYVSAGRYSEASQLLMTLVEMAPEMDPAWDMLTRSRIALDDVDGALRSVRAWQASGAPNAPSGEDVAALESAVGAAGARGYWSWTLARVEALAEAGGRVSLMDIATAHAALGNRDEAFDLLVDALERGDPAVLSIRSDPAWDEMRSDARFLELRRQTENIRFRRPRPPEGRGR